MCALFLGYQVTSCRSALPWRARGRCSGLGFDFVAIVTQASDARVCFTHLEQSCCIIVLYRHWRGYGFFFVCDWSELLVTAFGLASFCNWRLDVKLEHVERLKSSAIFYFHSNHTDRKSFSKAFQSSLSTFQVMTWFQRLQFIINKNF